MNFSTRTPMHQSDAMSSMIRSLMGGAATTTTSTQQQTGRFAGDDDNAALLQGLIRQAQDSVSRPARAPLDNGADVFALVRELAKRKEEEQRQNQLQQQLALIASLLAPGAQQQQQERERDVAHVLLRQLGLEPEPHARQTDSAAMAALLLGCNNGSGSGALTGATVSVSDAGCSSVGSGITSVSATVQTKADQKTPQGSTSNVSRRGRTAVFPQTLYQVLQDLEDQDKSNIASFTDDGKAFRIHSPKKFEEQIIPHYFPKMANYASFQRQLNLYDFIRVAEGPAQGSYAHKLFVKGEPIQASKIVRTKIKGKSSAALKKRITTKTD